MQTQSSLSREQVASLQGSYSCLHGLVVYLSAHQPYTLLEDQDAIQRLIDFATLCISRLVEHFDEVAAFEWKGRQP